MAKAEASEQMILQLRAVLRGISPLIWRRLLVPSYIEMWNGRWRGALHRLRNCYQGIRAIARTVTSLHAERVKRFRRHLIDLRNYLLSNQGNLTNYGKARRDGLRISSAPAESGMNHLINKRMGKSQPMRWSPDGAHLLIQVRCAVLDHRLEMLFREWFPRFRATPPLSPL